MIVLRRAAPDDAEQLVELAKLGGAGLTTLPPDLETIEKRIKASIRAFTGPEDESFTFDYLMVAEDTAAKRVIGTSTIFAHIGRERPFYCYRILRLAQMSRELNVRVDMELLQMTNDYIGSAEVGSLFLHPDYRASGAGRLIAKGRYMLMAAIPERFPDRVMAEIRGWVDEEDHSPFWESIGRYFFGMSFVEADQISGRGNSQFIADLMPKFPIYTALLPEKAREVIGKPNDDAVPAVRLLEREGFRFSGAVDIFDGGPTFEVARTNIWTVHHASNEKLAGFVDSPSKAEDATHIVATTELETYKCMLTKAVLTDGGLYLPRDCADALDLEEGDNVWISPLNPDVVEPQTERVVRELSD